MANVGGDGALYDVLGLGCVAIDDVLYVAEYPPADQKVPVHKRQRYVGGITATALVAAARLGGRCAYAGMLGNDEYSSLAAESLLQYGVDLAHVVRRAEARPILSVVVLAADQQTRSIFYDNSALVGADSHLPPAEIIRSARVLFVDNFGLKGMIRAASIAREAGIPRVADFETDHSSDFFTLLGLVDHLIISYALAAKLTGESDPVVAVEKLWNDERRAVVVTRGTAGAWYLTAAENSVQHQPAFQVTTVDSNGCGDVFHGAYALALAMRFDMRERMAFASAAAALKATASGGYTSIPTQLDVEKFMRQPLTPDNRA